MNTFVTISESTRKYLLFSFLKLLRIDYSQNPELLECARLVSTALGIIDYLKRIPFGLRKLKLYLPHDVMDKYNVNIRNLWNR
jgi:hypothetical protein